MQKRKKDDIDFRARVAATKLRLARERLGIPEKEARLNEMRFANHAARRYGEPDVYDEKEIESLAVEIRELGTQLIVS